MRVVSALFAAAFVSTLSVGCATRPEGLDRTYVGNPIAPQAPAAALVFDAPITAYSPPLDLDRQARMASAYLGYEGSTTVGTVTFDDRQYYNDAYGGRGGYGRSSSGYVDRQAYSQTTSVRQR